METGALVARFAAVERGGPERLASLSRADRKIVGRGKAGSGVGKVPPFAGVISEPLLAHGLDQHVAPTPLFASDCSARGVAGGIETVEARAHVEAIIGAALRDRGGKRAIGPPRVKTANPRRRRPC